MKKYLLSAGLVSLLCVSVLATAVFCYCYIQSIRRMHRLQAVAAEAAFNRNRIQSLANEAAEYGKRNKSMEMLLQSMNRSARSPASTNISRPTAK
jgi:predicted Holliday junction resolvase-like endonuclease